MAHDQESAAQIDAHDAVEKLEVGAVEAEIVHDAGVIDDDVDPPERVGRFPEQPRDVVGFADVALDGDGAAAEILDRFDDFSGLGGAAGEIHRDGESVLRQAQRDGTADAARGAGNDGRFRGGSGRSGRCIHGGFSFPCVSS